jgi:hypothetical protein
MEAWMVITAHGRFCGATHQVCMKADKGHNAI